MKTRIIWSSDPAFSASLRLDVTRLEHENLYEQVSQLLEVVRRVESELQRQERRIAALEGRGHEPRLGEPRVWSATTQPEEAGRE